jgi:hypothetical protein
MQWRMMAPPSHADWINKPVVHSVRDDFLREVTERLKYQSRNADLGLGSRWQDDFDDIPNLQGSPSRRGTRLTMPGPLKNARHERFAQELAKGKSQVEGLSGGGI